MQGGKAARSVPVAVPVLASGGLAVTALALPGLASVMWVGALALMAIALIAASRRSDGGRSKKKASIAATAFVVTAAIGFSVTWSAVSSVSSAGTPERLELSIDRSPTVQTVSVRTVVMDEETREKYEDTGAASITDTISQAQFVTGVRHDSYVAAAEAAGYRPVSGLTQSFADAEVMLVDDVYYITVPMLGTNIPDMTKVVYAYDGDTTQTFEYVAASPDPARASFQMWTDGTMVQNVDFYDPALDAAPGTEISQIFSWKKLNSCLSSAGIPSWLFGMIAVACAAICVGTAGLGCIGCIAAAGGFGSGIAAACVYYANT